MTALLYVLIFPATIIGVTILGTCLMEKLSRRQFIKYLQTRNKNAECLWWDDNLSHCQEAARHPEYNFFLVSQDGECGVLVSIAYDRHGNLVLPPTT